MMYHCTKCGWRIFSEKAIQCPKCKYGINAIAVPINAWHVLHTRYANAIKMNKWDASIERDWLDVEFSKLIPCGSCGGKWLDVKPTIDLSTPSTAFHSAWLAHNLVSTQHVQPAKQPITFERCKALYLQQPSMDDCCVAVTSLSLLPNHLAVQETCLNTWKRAGLSIHAKNRSGEIDLLKVTYPQVSHWHVCDDVPTEYSTRTQSIHALAQTAAEIGQPIMLINSDIEIHGEQQIIREAVADGVLVGIRHDYKDYWWTGSRFIWGFDAFTFTPEQARALPYDPYAIGKPVWDYWLPQHFRSIGQQINVIGEPFFFHKLHKTNWNEAEWSLGASWFYNRYGFMQTQPESVQFRKSLPFPPA